MTEATIQKKIKTFLEKQGAYIIKTIATSKNGVPDIIGCYKGMFFAIEVKHPDRKSNVSPLQQHNIDKINDVNGHAIVAWDLSHAKQLLEDMDELNRN